jgi:hypothetical protein
MRETPTMDDKSDSPEPATTPDSAASSGAATPTDTAAPADTGAPADTATGADTSNPPEAPPQTEPRGAELRRSKRRAFPFRQRVAFGVWDETPPEEAFLDVTFHDVSASGCSFTVEARPTEQRLLAQLGTESHILFVQAEVVHCTLKTLDGKETYLIGCRFLKRAE